MVGVLDGLRYLDYPIITNSEFQGGPITTNEIKCFEGVVADSQSDTVFDYLVLKQDDNVEFDAMSCIQVVFVLSLQQLSKFLDIDND